MGFDGAGGNEVDAANVPVEPFGHAALELITQAEVQRKPAGDLEIVLHKHAVIQGLVGAGCVAVDQSAGCLAEEKRGVVLPDGRGGGVIERAAREVGAEVVAARGMAWTEAILAVGSHIIAKLDLVLSAAENLRHGRLNRVDVVIGAPADGIAERLELADLKARDVLNTAEQRDRLRREAERGRIE